MILTNKYIENKTVFKSDICIVGSGISAQILASSIQNKNLILVESGKINFDQESQELNMYEEIGLLFRNGHVNRVRQLGGSANLWANQLMTLDEDDIGNRDWVIKDYTWPTNYSTLKEYYNRAINLVYSKNFNKSIFDLNFQEKFNDKDVDNYFKEDKIFEFKNHFWSSDVEKFNIHSKFTKKLLNFKNIKFIENFTCTNLHIDKSKNEIEFIDINSDSKKCKIYSKIFILACGALENARIILNNEKNSNLFQNKNTGKYFMDHPRRKLGTLKIKKKLDINSLYGIKKLHNEFRTSLKLSSKIKKENKILNSHCYLDPIFSKQDIVLFEQLLSDIKNIIKFKKFPKFEIQKFNLKKIFQLIYFILPNQISKSYINEFIYNYLKIMKPNLIFDELELNYQSEQFPNFDSKVFLGEKLDKFKQKNLIIDWKLHELDFKTTELFIEKINKKLKNSGFYDFSEKKGEIISDASHHSGTTRISRNRNDGVVDNNCKFHDIGNLFISGSSTFRISGSANPGLTNMAMSLRLADHINKTYV